MTLLVAALSDDAVWMVADTAISGGPIGLREREYLPKIVKAKGGLIGFAGDAHHGLRAQLDAAQKEPGEETLRVLQAATQDTDALEFAYAHRTAGENKLFKVKQGRAAQKATLHLGDSDAFSNFQMLRHRQEVEHAPDAIHRLLIAFPCPEGLSEATLAMLELFASRNDPGVGGWATPFVLDSDGAHLCSYAYSVSDPIVRSLRPGAAIPHGSAEAGGFDLSFAEFGDRGGAVIYWLQLPGGRTYALNETGYDHRVFSGNPEEFRSAVEQATGRVPQIWFGHPSPSNASAVKFLSDENGDARVAVIQNGRQLSFSWGHSSEAPFRLSGVIEMADHSPPEDRFTILPRDARDGLSIKGDGVSIELETAELDRLLLQLSEARAGLLPGHPFELGPGISMASQINPAWRTRASPIPETPGTLLSLRHSGFGWLGFFIPTHEQASLGRWLVNDAKHRGFNDSGAE